MTELIVGREAGTEKPRLAITVNGTTHYLGTPGLVPKTVSRKHCKIVIGKDSVMTVEDLTENNFMYVNGKECKRMENVSLADTIELGSSKFRVDVDTVLKGLSGKMAVSIGHLKEIYETYQERKIKMQRSQQLLGVLSALPGVLSMISIGAAFIFPGGNVRIVMIAIAAIMAVSFAVVRVIYVFRNPKMIQKLEDDFHDNYVCPHTLCTHYLGQIPYKELVKNHSCPYCHCKYKE